MTQARTGATSSDVLIAHLRGATAARAWLRDARRSSGPLHASVVTVTEITGGMRSAERREAARLLSILQPHAVTEVVARRAGGLMRTCRRAHAAIGLGDDLVAATAELAGLELATLNVKHYPMFPNLEPPF